MKDKTLVEAITSSGTIILMQKMPIRINHTNYKRVINLKEDEARKCLLVTLEDDYVLKIYNIERLSYIPNELYDEDNQKIYADSFKNFYV